MPSWGRAHPPLTPAARLRRRAPQGALAPCSAPGPRSAQGSTSLGSGLPGDVPDPHLAGVQIDDSGVGMSAFRSSTGRVLAVAPVLETRAQFLAAPTFFTARISARAIRVDQRRGREPARPGLGRVQRQRPDGCDDPLQRLDRRSRRPRPFAAPRESQRGGGELPTWFCELAQLDLGGIESDGFAHLRRPPRPGLHARFPHRRADHRGQRVRRLGSGLVRQHRAGRARGPRSRHARDLELGDARWASFHLSQGVRVTLQP